MIGLIATHDYGHKVTHVSVLITTPCYLSFGTNRDHFASFGGDVGDHILGGGELGRVPGEVALAVRVLNVQPDDIAGNVVLVEFRIHSGHVLFISVVPFALKNKC